MSAATYIETLDALSRMRIECKGELALPEMCVIGDQSSGKSSVLQCLTSIEFPVKSGICTKVPTVVECRRADNVKYEIRAGPNAQFEVVQPKAVSAAISKAQRSIIGSGGSKVSDKEITLRVSGPDMLDIQIVDLPGIIHNGEDEKQETTRMIKKYIESPQTLILLVHEAKTDEELVSALQLAQDSDKGKERTLRILTKFDTFDSEASRNTAIDLIESDLENPLGAHAVVCRPEGDAEYDKEREFDVFQKHGQQDVDVRFFKERMGVDTLKQRLPDLFTSLIQTNLPGLRASAVQRMQQEKAHLTKLGEMPLDSVMMVRECQRVLCNALPSQEFSVVITPAFERFRGCVHGTGEMIHSDWIDEFMLFDAFECPFYQGGMVYKRCMEEVVRWWRSYAKHLIKDVGRALGASITAIIEKNAIGVSSRLRKAIDLKWGEVSKGLADTLTKACNEALDECVDFGTSNHYLFSKYVQEQILPDETIELVLASVFSPCYVEGNISKKLTPSEVREALLAAQETLAAEDRQQAIQEHVAKKTLNAVKATWSVEKKTITDAILKKIRDMAVKARSEWIHTGLLTDGTIRDAAVEDDDVNQQRAQCNRIIESMAKVIEEVDTLSPGLGDVSGGQSAVC